MTISRERLVNNYQSTLNGAIDNVVTSLVVTSATGLPSTGDFRIRINSELMLVTAISGTTLSGLTRGIEGTTAASHANGDSISAVLTSGSLDRYGNDYVPTWGYVRPYKIVNDAGTAPLVASDFTWVNQEGASVVDQNGTILMTTDLGTDGVFDLRIQQRSAPTTPYAYIAAFQVVMPRHSSDDSCQLAFGFRESATDESTILRFGISTDQPGEIAVQNYTNSSTPGTFPRAGNAMCLIAPVIWMRIEDTSVNLIYSVGMDGNNWIQILSQSRTVLMAGGPDRIFWGAVNNENTGNTTMVRLLHWSKE